MYHDVDQIYELLIELELFTEEELKLLTYINGFNIQTLEDALYARYGYRDVDQLLEELNGEDDDDEDDDDGEEDDGEEE